MENNKTFKRTKPVGSNGDPELLVLQNRVQTLSEVIGRMELAAKMGYQYGTSRDIFEALGYPRTLRYSDLRGRYDRQDIAKAIINRPVNATWNGNLELIESDDDQETELEKVWKDLEKKMGLKSRFMRLDKLVGIGEYGVLMLGLSDARNQQQQSTPVRGKNVQLLYVKPFSQNDARILTYDTKTSSERYGKPVTYEINIADVASGDSTTIHVHYSRVIHVADGLLESEVKGTPRLQAVFNRLMDLEKLIGGSAEMFWRGGRPGYSAMVDKDFQMTDAMKEDLKNQINEYEHHLRRFLVNEGVDWKSLALQIADPKSHVDVQIQMIAAVTGIPKRILTGSERGELASSEDKGEWLTYVKTRREGYAEPVIVRPFVDRCMELGILPEVADYEVGWEDLFSISDKEKMEIAKGLAEALSKYASGMAQDIIPPDAFLEFILKLPEEQIKLIQEFREQAMKEEEEENKQREEMEEEIRREMGQQQPQVPGQQNLPNQNQ